MDLKPVHSVEAKISSLPSSSAPWGRSNDSQDDEAEVFSPPVREDGFQYDVFLSFRGPDTRKTFTDLLYEVLKDKGIITFIDSEKLEKGQKLEVLLECIQKSQIFVAIFSPGYADSKWCLKEIAKMVECKRVILPVFVDVEPTDVRRQTGPFGSAFSKHRNNKEIDEEEVSKWRNALKEAGGVSGYTLASTDGYQGKLLRQIVKRILSEVNMTSKLHVAQHPVGLDSRILDVIKVLETEAQDDARMVGIYGMGGIGKTTLSKAVYNEISSHFDALSFISNVREAAKLTTGLVPLQKQLLGDVFNDKHVTISNTSDGLGQIKKRIGAKKVLLVLDDVDDASQINELVGQLEWFRSGSRIITTTRDKRVLTLAKVKENHVYELKGLDDIQSLELFSWHAFGKKEPNAKFADLSNEVASTAAGLPLALTIFGSHFFDLTTVEDWRDMLKKLKEDLDKKIHERLKISFDVLDDNEKEVFLDIACFFVGQETKNHFIEWGTVEAEAAKETKYATFMWEACRFSPKRAINQLIHKSLVSIGNGGNFEMHDHIRDMARKIVQEKAKAGKHTRLWKNDETVDVLQNKRGMEHVEAIKLFPQGMSSVYLDVNYLAAMSQLRMLLLGRVTLTGGYEHFPWKLKWLKWNSEGRKEFLGSFPLEEIVVLDLSQSWIGEVRDPRQMRVKVFNQLKVLDLSHCQWLYTCPDFASMIHLEMLSFLGCHSMTELHSSIGLLRRLTDLCLSFCYSLKELPQEVWQLAKLEKLHLINCSGITTFPSRLGYLKSLKQHLLGELKVLIFRGCDNLTMCPDFMGMPYLEILDFAFCLKISELHPHIGHLKSLANLDLGFCDSLKKLPQEVWQLTSLKKLDLCGCKGIIALPLQIRNAESLKEPLLENLHMSNCSNLIMCPDFTSMPRLQSLSFAYCSKITKLDPSIGQLKRLMHLNLCACGSLKELPQEIGQLTSLESLELSCCCSLKEVPQEVWQLTSLRNLDLAYCGQITALPSQVRNVESLKQLNRLDVTCCTNLITCPDFMSMPHLQELCLRGCEKIAELDPSIGQLKRLMDLDLIECVLLKELPQEIGQLTSLKSLDLGSCSQISTLPQSMGQLKQLQRLSLLECSSFKKMPECIISLDQLRVLVVSDCKELKFLPLLPPSLNELNASRCHQLESMADVSNLKGLWKLTLTGCARLEGIPGIEQLKCLKLLHLGGCRQLADPLFARFQGANFQHLEEFSIPRKPTNDGLSDPQSITFILPKQFQFCTLCLYVDQRSLNNICSELEKSNGTSTLPDKRIAKRRKLGKLVVHVNITTDDAQFSFTTSFTGWDYGRSFPTARFARGSKLMMMAKQGRFKGNDVDDAQRRGMMEMCVSIDGCVLLHGELWMPKGTVIDEDPDEYLDEDHDEYLDEDPDEYLDEDHDECLDEDPDEYLNEDPDEDPDEDHDEAFYEYFYEVVDKYLNEDFDEDNDSDPSRVRHNIVRVKFG